MDSLGKLIRLARGQKTQEQFARELKVTRMTVYSWEQGITRPSDDKMREMGVKVEYELTRKVVA